MSFNSFQNIFSTLIKCFGQFCEVGSYYYPHFTDENLDAQKPPVQNHIESQTQNQAF